jgi:hypothetical protein
MHKESLMPSIHEPVALTAIDLTETHPHTAAPLTMSQPKTSTARHTARDFTPIQALQLLRIDDVCRLLRISKDQRRAVKFAERQ